MTDFQSSCLETYSSKELVCFIQNSKHLPHHAGIKLLSNTHIAKRNSRDRCEDARGAIELARGLGVRTPRAVREVEVDDIFWCIFERVEGPTLEETWATVGWFQSIILAFQLRGFIRRLRSVTSTTAGSLVTGSCRSFWLDDRFGLPAWATPDNIYAFIDFWSEIGSPKQEVAKTPAQHREPPRQQHLPPVTPLVFTHHDLAPRNMILHPSGQLWLLDWDYAGYYPPSFEYAAMHNFHIPPGWSRWARMRWRAFCWIATGFYDKEMNVLLHVKSRFQRYRNFRRFHILGGGYASASRIVPRADD